jgi:hypothetical protein
VSEPRGVTIDAETGPARAGAQTAVKCRIVVIL